MFTQDHLRSSWVSIRVFIRLSILYFQAPCVLLPPCVPRHWDDVVGQVGSLWDHTWIFDHHRDALTLFNQLLARSIVVGVLISILCRDLASRYITLALFWRSTCHLLLSLIDLSFSIEIHEHFSNDISPLLKPCQLFLLEGSIELFWIWYELLLSWLVLGANCLVLNSTKLAKIFSWDSLDLPVS